MSNIFERTEKQIIKGSRSVTIPIQAWKKMLEEHRSHSASADIIYNFIIAQIEAHKKLLKECEENKTLRTHEGGYAEGATEVCELIKAQFEALQL